MADKDIYMLAFDHLVEFEAIFAQGEEPTQDEVDLMREAKKVVFRGVQRAIETGVPRKNAAILIDEQYGLAVMEKAHEAQVAFSMPVDPPRGGVILPPGWRDSLTQCAPTWVKPLLWYNVEGDRAENERQIKDTHTLQDWLRENNQQMLLEILTPVAPHQLESVGGDADRFRAELLPQLILRAMQEIYAAGIRPAVWKIEGVPTVEGTKAIGEFALTTGAGCLVLGSGAEAATVGKWLALASATPGYRGFAVGRTIWQQPVLDWITDRDDDRLVEQIAKRYSALVDAYTGSLATSQGSR